MLYELFSSHIGRLSFVDALLIATYLVACLMLGIKKAGSIKNMKDYALGGNISTMALVATIYASYLGAGSTISNIEKISAIGALVAVTILITPIRWILSVYIFGKNIEQFRGCITMGDIMYRLYDQPGRIVTCIALLLDNIASVAVQVLALGYLLNYFLDISITYSVIIGFGTLIFYSALGGARAVIITDVFQFAMFYIIIPVLCALMIHQVGGLSSIMDIVPEDKWHISLSEIDNKWMFWGAVLYAFLPPATGIFVQRFLVSMKATQLSRALFIVAIVDLTIMVMVCIFGFILSAEIGAGISAKNVVWHVMGTSLPTVIKGMAVVGVLAIIMSTADSYINVTGVLIARDIVKSVYPKISDRTEIIVAQVSTVLAGVVSAAIALRGESVWELIWLAVNFYCPVMVMPVVAGFLRFRTNSTSFIISVVGALTGIGIGYIAQGKLDVLSTLFGLIGSATGLFTGHYVQKWTGTLKHVARREQAYISQWRKELAQEMGVPVKDLDNVLAKKEVQEFRQEKKWWHNMVNTISDFHLIIKSFKLRDILEFCYQGVQHCPPRYYQFAAFGLFYCLYPLIFFDVYIEKMPFAEEYPLWLVEILLRISAAFCCLAIGLSDVWSYKASKKYFPLYWHAVLTLVLPVIGIYSYLADPHEGGILMGTALGIFALAAFVDWLRFCAISIVGFIIANLLYLIFSLLSHETAYYGGDIASWYTIYLVAAIAVAFLMRYAQQHEMQVMKVFSGAIAHEVKSPIASAYSAIGVLTEIIKKAQVSSVQNAEDGRKVRHLVINESDYELIEYIADNVKILLSRGMKSSESMLAALSGARRTSDLALYSINDIIREVLDTYGFTASERERIEFDYRHDFEFYGSSSLFRNVLYNLLGNSIKYAGENVKIKIWNVGHSVHFKDFGKGIKAASLPNIFNLFYTKEAGGTGVGLALSKTIVTLMGGKIACRSIEGQFTEFIITLPEPDTTHLT